MTENAEILLEGSYQYLQNNNPFSQETFKLVHMKDTQTYVVFSEINSRIETEFLKILVRYEMNHQFIPTYARVEKSIGNKYALETFKVDVQNMELRYMFQNGQGSHEFKRNMSPKHFFTTPAVCTSAFFTLSKKLDATGRTGIVFVGSDNDWTYKGPPTEKIVFAEFKSRELSDFQLQGNTLSASHLCLHEHDATEADRDQTVELFLSKHFAIPYQLINGDLKITVKSLKKMTP